MLAAMQIVVPGIAVAVVVLVLRREQYQALGAAADAGSRWWLGGPVALVVGLVLVVTLAVVGLNWYTEHGRSDLVGFSPAALITVLHYRRAIRAGHRTCAHCRYGCGRPRDRATEWR